MTTVSPGTASIEPDRPFLLLQNVIKSFDGIHAVNDVSVAIEQGEIFALLGSSGCGKSTLLRMLAGFETPTSGKILLEGKSLTEIAPHERPINMMFQSYALFPHLTVWDNIAFGLRRAGLQRDVIAEQVRQMLELVQMHAYAQRKPHQLSGGQQQRVALARSLARRPKLLLLDEPLGALDKKLRERTQVELVNIIEQVGVTCVMVTHDQDEAMSMASRVAVMSEGRIRQVGVPGDVYETPSCVFVADFIGNINLFAGQVQVDEADHIVVSTSEAGLSMFVPHGITGTLGMPVHVGVRPEKIVLQLEPPQAGMRANACEHGHNSIEGVIASVAYFGNQTHYVLRLDSGTTLKVSRVNSARFDSAGLERGQRAHAWWDGSDAVVLTS